MCAAAMATTPTTWARRPDSLWHMQFHETKAAYYFIALGLLALALGVTRWIERSRRGYYLRAIREDQEAAASLGVGENPAKRVEDPFEEELLLLLSRRWGLVMVDAGAPGSEEEERVRRAAERAQARGARPNAGWRHPVVQAGASQPPLLHQCD